MDNITEKELKVLNVIKETMDMYSDGFSDLMLEDIAGESGYSISTTKGILGSLTKKGYAGFMDVNGEYNIYYLLKEGCDAMGIEPEYYEDLL